MERKRVTDAQFKVVGKGQARVRLARLNRRDHDGDVILPGFFPSTPIYAPIQPAHVWTAAALGKAKVWAPQGSDEVLSDLVFNLNAAGGAEFWSAVHFDADPATGPSVQEYSWGFQIKAGAARQGHFEGEPVRFLGPAPDGSEGVLLAEVSPVVKGASVGSGTLQVRGQGSGDRIGPGHPGWKGLLQIRRALLQRELAILQAKQAETQWFAATHEETRRQRREGRDAKL